MHFEDTKEKEMNYFIFCFWLIQAFLYLFHLEILGLVLLYQAYYDANTINCFVLDVGTLLPRFLTAIPFHTYSLVVVLRKVSS